MFACPFVFPYVCFRTLHGSLHVLYFLLACEVLRSRAETGFVTQSSVKSLTHRTEVNVAGCFTFWPAGDFFIRMDAFASWLGKQGGKV